MFYTGKPSLIFLSSCSIILASDLILPNSTVFYQVWCTLFYMENDAEIFPVHYTWKVAEKGFKMACMINKLAMINCCEIILET